MGAILFDIDGTLIHTQGMGCLAVDQTFEKLYGITGISTGVSLAGRTDYDLFREFLVKGGIVDEATDHNHPEIPRLIESYLDTLETLLTQYQPNAPHVGVLDLLKALDVAGFQDLGILTGNVQRGATLKLRHFALTDFFSFGAYGDDQVQRSLLLPIALKRAEAIMKRRPDVEKTIVIGDAIGDILCAKDNGARVIAVATGPTPHDVLAKYEPDLLVEDLRDTQKLAEFIMEVQGRF